MKIKAVYGIMLTLLLTMLPICSFTPIVEAETSGSTEKYARAHGTAGTTTLGLKTVVTLFPVADSYVNSSSPDSNYGSETSINIEITTGTTKNYTYTYVMFDLSSIPLDAVITSSNLSLYMTYFSAWVTFPPYAYPSITIHYCSDTSWTELGITWNNKPPFDPQVTSGLGGWIFQLYQYYNWNVTSDVSRALSNGKLTEVVKWPNYTDPDDYGRARFQSKEAPMKPKLIVEYLRAPAASEKYALLLSGGVNPTYNYPRYRNDLSFIYKTLLNYYNFQEDYVITIYFDGSSLDLDSDGDNDVDYAATEPNVNTAFNRIKASLDADDLFFIFVTDHGIGYDREADPPGTGGFDDLLREDLNGFPVDEGDEHEGYGYDEAICLWDSDDNKEIEADEVTLDDELATLVSGAAGTIVFVFEQCFSGGFIDDLSASGRIIMTACLEEETSHGISITTIGYNYFAYHWTAAVQGSCADANRDRQISMQEAFNYTIANDEAYTSVEYDSVDTETCQIDDPDGKGGTTTLGLRTRFALCPIADSYVNSLQPDSNYGSEDRLKTQITSGTPKDYNYTYIMFDLTYIPSDVVIQSANLSLFAWSYAYPYPPPDPGPKIYAHYCSNSSWTELGITWNNMPAFDPVDTGYIDQPSLGYNTWNVTEDVISALSNGKLTEVLKWPNYTQSWAYAWIEFQSREETYLDSYLIRGYKPKLTVFVTIMGDVNGDGSVDASDLSDFSEAYGSESGDSNWNLYCDFNSDHKVDASDLFDLGKNYGKTT